MVRCRLPSPTSSPLWGRPIHQVRFAIRAALATAPVQFTGLVALYITWGLGPALGVRVLQHLINLAIAGAGHGVAGFRALLPWLALFLGSLLLGDSVMWDLKDPLEQRMRQRLEAAGGLPLLAFEESETFDRLEQSDHPGEAVSDLLEGVFELLQGGVGAVSLSVLFLPVGLWLPGVLLLALIPQGVRAARLNLQWVAFTYDQTEAQRRAAYLDRVLTGRGEQKELRVFTLHHPLAEHWRQQRGAVRRLRLAEKRRMTWRQLPTDLLPGALTLLGAVDLSVRLAHHALNAGQFVALLGGLGAFESARLALLNSLHDLQTFAAQVGALEEFLAPPAPPPGQPSAVSRPLRDGIRCAGISFTYPGRDAPTLDGLDLHIAPGERVALVGPNGAGKSTLAKILLGLYPANPGRVTIDGADIAGLPPEDLHTLVAAAFQDFVRFELTVRENIEFGRPGPGEALPAPAGLLAAARAAGADAVAADLPNAYDHPVGHILDGGSDLSGGQWQRLALARAFRRDPALLILDEPTAALDPQAEADLYSRLGAASAVAGRALLLVSHRLGSARLADRVLVLHGGRIAEDGTHDDLVHRDGLYAQMWKEQSQWYR